MKRSGGTQRQVKPSELRMVRTCAAGTSRPRTRDRRSIVSVTRCSFVLPGNTSTMPVAARPPQSSTSSLTARAAAIGGSSGLNPFSKRVEASVRSFRAWLVRRTLVP